MVSSKYAYKLMELRKYTLDSANFVDANLLQRRFNCEIVHVALSSAT